ncbi:hypothetical protein DPMN_136848 [Dreissena polymorpha]|uniref:Uncharacterized protein n=1 Tax=Dreissena polymorpha TaxID=45954 RepID=A0A9D4JI91_DREPO|nr:hypothetical protein DPMN_136848 [Dreissena polymorpha]
MNERDLSAYLLQRSVGHTSESAVLVRVCLIGCRPQADYHVSGGDRCSCLTQRWSACCGHSASGRCLKRSVVYYWFWLSGADPGGTAIPGQPVTRAEQAPDISSVSKNQFNIEVPQWGTYQILS